MKKKMPEVVVDYSKRKRTVLFRIVSFLGALLILLGMIPMIYLFIGKFINQWFSIPCPRTVELILAAGIGIAGLLIMLWSTWAQWAIGRGGPVPVAPTQKLIISGPYAYCRNPMHLGTAFYCFAFGVFWGNFTVGLVCMVLEYFLILVYAKCIEEKELEIRFGKEYLEYKKNTPFLIPTLRKHKYD